MRNFQIHEKYVSGEWSIFIKHIFDIQHPVYKSNRPRIESSKRRNRDWPDCGLDRDSLIKSNFTADWTSNSIQFSPVSIANCRKVDHLTQIDRSAVRSIHNFYFHASLLSVHARFFKSGRTRKRCRSIFLYHSWTDESRTLMKLRIGRETSRRSILIFAFAPSRKWSSK